MSGNKKTIIHPLPSKEFLSTLRLRGPSAVPLVKRVNLPNGQSYHPVFLPFDTRIICPWCCKESAISTYPQHIQGPKHCEKHPDSILARARMEDQFEDQFLPVFNESNVKKSKKKIDDSDKSSDENNDKKSKKRRHDSDKTRDSSDKMRDASDSDSEISYRKKKKRKHCYRDSESSEDSDSSESTKKLSKRKKHKKKKKKIIPSSSSSSSSSLPSVKFNKQSSVKFNKQSSQNVRAEPPKIVPAQNKEASASETSPSLEKAAKKTPTRKVAPKKPQPNFSMTTRAPAAANQKSPPSIAAHESDAAANQESPPSIAAHESNDNGIETDETEAHVQHLPGGVPDRGGDHDPDIQVVNQIQDE
jgi:hypothetical protein